MVWRFCCIVWGRVLVVLSDPGLSFFAKYTI